MELPKAVWQWLKMLLFEVVHDEEKEEEEEEEKIVWAQVSHEPTVKLVWVQVFHELTVHCYSALLTGQSEVTLGHSAQGVVQTQPVQEAVQLQHVHGL